MSNHFDFPQLLVDELPLRQKRHYSITDSFHFQLIYYDNFFRRLKFRYFNSWNVLGTHRLTLKSARTATLFVYIIHTVVCVLFAFEQRCSWIFMEKFETSTRRRFLETRKEVLRERAEGFGRDLGVYKKGPKETHPFRSVGRTFGI